MESYVIKWRNYATNKELPTKNLDKFLGWVTRLKLNRYRVDNEYIYLSYVKYKYYMSLENSTNSIFTK